MAVDTSTECHSQRQTLKEVKKSIPIRAWYYNPNDEPPCQPHQYYPNREVPTDHLQKLGVLTWTQIETDGFENNRFLNQIKSARGYNYEEVLTVTPGKLPNFEENTKKFFMEHLHDHEEIRFILDGVGYEDVRDFDGQWIRIEIKKGDLIVLPPGMYHRFTLDEDQYLKALLLYQGTPVAPNSKRTLRQTIWKSVSMMREGCGQAGLRPSSNGARGARGRQSPGSYNKAMAAIAV